MIRQRIRIHHVPTCLSEDQRLRSDVSRYTTSPLPVIINCDRSDAPDCAGVARTYRIHTRIILSTKVRSWKIHQKIVERDNDSKYEEEHAMAKPNLDTYKLPVPYPQALNRPKAKIDECDDHLLEAFKKVTITMPLIYAIKHIPSYEKFLKGICTPHRNLKGSNLEK